MYVKIELNDSSSFIYHCGNISDKSKVERSCRHWDLISPYLFNICVEILFINARDEKNIRSFRIGHFQEKLDFYADDLIAYLDGPKKRRKYYCIRINLSKCKAGWIGKNIF